MNAPGRTHGDLPKAPPGTDAWAGRSIVLWNSFQPQASIGARKRPVHTSMTPGAPERAGSPQHLSFSEMLMLLSTLGSFFPLA